MKYESSGLASGHTLLKEACRMRRVGHGMVSEQGSHFVMIMRMDVFIDAVAGQLHLQGKTQRIWMQVIKVSLLLIAL